MVGPSRFRDDAYIRCQLRLRAHSLADGIVCCLSMFVWLTSEGGKRSLLVAGGLQPSDCIARTREQMESAEMCLSLRLTVRISTCSCEAARYSQFVPSGVLPILAVVGLDLAQRSQHWQFH